MIDGYKTIDYSKVLQVIYRTGCVAVIAVRVTLTHWPRDLSVHRAGGTDGEAPYGGVPHPDSEVAGGQPQWGREERLPHRHPHRRGDTHNDNTEVTLTMAIQRWHNDNTEVTLTMTTQWLHSQWQHRGDTHNDNTEVTLTMTTQWWHSQWQYRGETHCDNTEVTLTMTTHTWHAQWQQRGDTHNDNTRGGTHNDNREATLTMTMQGWHSQWQRKGDTHNDNTEVTQ